MCIAAGIRGAEGAAAPPDTSEYKNNLFNKNKISTKLEKYSASKKKFKLRDMQDNIFIY